VSRVRFLDLRRGISSSSGELDAALAGVLEAGQFVGGEPVERFEREFAAYCGAGHAVGTASGTDAITLALRAVGIRPGDEVITVANTCVPTVAGIEAAGAAPVLVDALASTMTIDPESAARAIGPRTRAIVPVHLYGRCADMDPILELASEHGLKVVEDCAQAHGASDRGRRAGTMGDAAAFSFYPTKNLGALGDGGAVTTDDSDTADRVRMLRSYGERERYDSVIRGMNSRLDTMQAAVLSVRLRHLDRQTARRREIAARYGEAVTRAGLVAPTDPPGGAHVYHLYVLAVDDRAAFRRRLLEAGVETLVHYPQAVHQHTAYRDLDRPGELDASERLSREVVSLPLYAELSDEEVDEVVEAVFSAAEVSRSA
jgi:dTDP-4-amino-4,6-dideoxygalactose transaminase